MAAAAPLPRARAGPDARRFNGGVHAPGEAAVDPRALTAALLVGAARPSRGSTGARRRGHPRPSAWSAAALRAASAWPGCGPAPGGEELRADARRPRRRRLVGRRPSGCPRAPGPPVRPVKGQIVELRGRDGEPPACERIVASERVYLVPRARRPPVVGATVEEQGFDTAVTAGGVHELLREAYRLLPDVAEMELVGAIAGLRPGTPDNLPLIGPGADRRPGPGHRPLPQRHPPGAAGRQAVADLREPAIGVRPWTGIGDPRTNALFGGGTKLMRIELNGEPRELPEGATLADAVREPPAPGRAAAGVAVALDGEVVPRGEWEATPLREGQAVEVLAAIQGGRRADDLGAGRPRVGLAPDRRHRRLPLARADGGGARRLRDRDRHRRPAPHRPRRRGLGPRRDRPPRPLRPAQHRRLLHRPRRRPHRQARPRGLRDRLDQARGDRRRPHPLSRTRSSCSTPPNSSSPTASPSSPTPTTTRSSPAASRRPAAPR